jgi:hypothetical protein
MLKSITSALQIPQNSANKSTSLIISICKELVFSFKLHQRTDISGKQFSYSLPIICAFDTPRLTSLTTTQFVQGPIVVLSEEYFQVYHNAE